MTAGKVCAIEKEKIIENNMSKNQKDTENSSEKFPPSTKENEPPPLEINTKKYPNSINEINTTNSINSHVTGENFFPLDEASSHILELTAELEAQRKVAMDSSLPLEKRLEAFEDIMESEIGDTSLHRARNIEREIGLRQIYLKFEGGNPTGTQKDRIAFSQAMDALRSGYQAITTATCGNYGVAVALAASLAGLKCIIFIPENYHTKRAKEMISFGAELFRVPGDYERAVIVSRDFADSQNDVYDANPGGTNTILQLKAYGEIAYEIYDELRDAPSALAVPVSNGTTLAGIHRGFLSLYRRGKTSKIPKMIGGSSYRKNPIIHAFIKNIPTCQDLKPEQIKETAINEPLINWQSIDGDQALAAIRLSNGWAEYASDKSMLYFSRLIREQEGLNILPAAAAGLIALLEKHKRETLPNDRYVVILTGRK